MEAEVLFEYEKTQDDELNLRPGDIIRDVKQVDDGWCEGELNGLRGMFPDNFVKLRPASQPAPSSHPAPAPAPVPDSSTSVPLRNADPSKKQRRAKVTFSYAADNMDELSLQPGQIVDVLEEEEEGWWRGRIGNQEGVFPSNFVEEFEEEAEPSPPSKPLPPQHTEAPPPVDSQTGERHPPPNGEVTDGSAASHKPVRGPMVMPAFDPSKARAGLKKSTVAPPLEKPPEHKKAAPPPQSNAPKPTEKPVEQAKVTYEYEADNDDELTIRVGDIVEIINKNVDQQDGWWEVSLRGKRGLIPDNFVELLPVQPPPQPASASPPQPKHVPPPAAAQPKHVPSKPAPPAAKEPVKQPVQPPAPAAKAVKKPPAPTPQPKSEPSPPDDQNDFPVPKTVPLDTSAVKDRPKNRNRPPSRSNLLNHEPEPSPTPAAPPPAEEPPSSDANKNLSPWQAELMKKKRQPKLAPKPKPTPAHSSTDFSPKLPRASIGSKDQVSKPEPPPAARTRLNTGGGSKPDLNHPAAAPKPAAAKPVQPPAGPAKPLQTKPVETKAPPPQDTPSQSEPPSSSPVPTTVVPDNAWKEAYEKLKEDFEKFKEHVTRELQILTDDLDKERKHRAGLDIDIDRLKKAQRTIK